MFCKRCNSAVSNESKYCPQCGGELQKSYQAKGSVSEAGRFWITLTLMSIVIVGAVSLVVGVITDDSPAVPLVQPDPVRTNQSSQLKTPVSAKNVISHTFRSYESEIAEADISADKELFDPKPLYTVVQNQISDVKAGNLEKSYSYNSKDFRAATTPEVFGKFIKSHPAFIENKSIEFEKIAVENNVVTLSGKLVSKKNHAYPFNYSLVYENGGWKVLHIEVFAEKDTQSATHSIKPSLDNGLIFEKFSLGTNVNGEGLITDPKTNFSPASGQIHLNLFVKNGVAGTDVEVEFLHVESGSKAPPAVAKIPDNGDMVLSFAFTPPVKGWPKGNYRIEAKSSTQARGGIAFKVE